MLVHHVHKQHILQDLVHSFCLPICLWVICCTKVKLGSQGILETSPKSSYKHRSSIGYDPLRKSMKYHNIADKKSSCVWILIRRMHREKMCTLVRVSTTKKIESCLLSVSDNPRIRSITMTSHFNFGIACGGSNPYGCVLGPYNVPFYPNFLLPLHPCFTHI